VFDELVAVHHPVVGGELHGEAVDQRCQAHGRSVRIGAGELAGVDPDADDAGQQFGRLLVEALADLLHHRVAQGLAPAIDPQHPLDVVAAFRYVVLDDPFELAEGGRRALDLAFHLGDVFLGVVLESLGEQLLLGVEVVVDEAAGDVEPLGDIGDAGAGKAAFDDDLARRFQNLVAALGNSRLLDHCGERYRSALPSVGASARLGSSTPVSPVGCGPMANCSRMPMPCSMTPSGPR
jgi:hypothetical protein